jgi:hypothetical protein
MRSCSGATVTEGLPAFVGWGGHRPQKVSCANPSLLRDAVRWGSCVTPAYGSLRHKGL